MSCGSLNLDNDCKVVKIPSSQHVVVKHLAVDEIKNLIRHSDDIEIVKILIFINNLYNSMTIREAVDIVGYSYETGLRWLDNWNNDGLDGIKYKWGEGRPPKLTSDQLKELKEDMININLKTTKEIKKHIKDKWDVDFNISWIPKLLRSIGAKYGKPYPIYANEPSNADEILHEQVKNIKKELKEKNIEFKDLVFVFMDERSFNNQDNSQRVWYFDKNIVKKNPSRERANTIVYYTPNGESHVEFLEKSTKECITWSLFNFLKKTKKKQ
jgi:putative transposase